MRKGVALLVALVAFAWSGSASAAGVDVLVQPGTTCKSGVCGVLTDDSDATQGTSAAWNFPETVITGVQGWPPAGAPDYAQYTLYYKGVQVDHQVGGPFSGGYYLSVNNVLADSITVGGPVVAKVSVWGQAAVAAPGNPASVVGTGGSGSITVSWSAPSSGGAVDGYNVYVDGVLSYTGAALTYTKVVAEGSHSVRVTAYNAGGESSGVTVTATAQHVAVVPGVPSGLTAEADDHRVTLSWSAPVGGDAAAGYKVYRDTVFIQTVSGTSYVDTGLVNGQAYSYRVAAYNVTGDGAWTSAVTATPVHVASVPGQVVGLSAKVSGRDIVVAWVAPETGDAPTGYELTIDGGLPIMVEGTSYTDVSPPYDVGRLYTVWAVNGAGKGPGVSAGATVPNPDRWPGPPALVQGLTADWGKTTVLLVWSASPEGDVTAYRVYDGAGALVAQTAALSATVQGLSLDTEYTYTVTAVDGDANESPPASVTGRTGAGSAYDAAVGYAGGAVGALLLALWDGFKPLALVGLGLVVLVTAVFWLLRRGRQMADRSK